MQHFGFLVCLGTSSQNARPISGIFALWPLAYGENRYHTIGVDTVLVFHVCRPRAGAGYPQSTRCLVYDVVAGQRQIER